MIISLTQNRIHAAASVAVREQAFVGGNGVLGVATRLDGESEYTGHWDVTAVLEAIHQGVALQWQARELTVWTRDVARHFAIQHPGAGDSGSDQIDIVASSEFDRLLLLAQQADGSTTTIPLLQVAPGAPIASSPVQWVVTCPSTVCACPDGRPAQDRAEIEYLASVHDLLHHRGALTAEVTPAARVTKVAWEVDGPDGTPIYLGCDIELAWELYHLTPAHSGSHLLPAAAAISGGGR